MLPPSGVRVQVPTGSAIGSKNDEEQPVAVSSVAAASTAAVGNVVRIAPLASPRRRGCGSMPLVAVRVALPIAPVPLHP